MKFIVILFAFCLIFASQQVLSNSNSDSEPLFAAKKDSVWYFFDHAGNSMFPSKKFKKIGGYREGFFVVVFTMDKKDHWGFMNLKGDVFKPQNCDEVRLFRNGMAMTIKYIDTATGESHYGFINKDGEQVIPNKFLDATDFNDGLGWVMNKTERGYINMKGKFVATFEGRKFGNPFFEGRAVFHDESELFGFLDTSFKPIINPQYDELGNYSEGLATFSENSKYGYINKDGKKVITAKFDAATEFKEGIAVIGQADTSQKVLWGIINKSGKVIVDWQYQVLREFSEGMIAAQKDEKWIFIDQMGNQVIKKEYEYAESFKNGLAYVSSKKEGKRGYINPLGEWIILLDDKDIIVDLRWNRVVK